MKRTNFRRLSADERGEDLIEYGLLAAFAATVVTTVLIGDPLNLQAAVIHCFQRCLDALRQLL